MFCPIRWKRESVHRVHLVLMLLVEFVPLFEANFHKLRRSPCLVVIAVTVSTGVRCRPRAARANASFSKKEIRYKFE